MQLSSATVASPSIPQAEGGQPPGAPAHFGEALSPGQSTVQSNTKSDKSRRDSSLGSGKLAHDANPKYG